MFLFFLLYEVFLSVLLEDKSGITLWLLSGEIISTVGVGCIKQQIDILLFNLRQEKCVGILIIMARHWDRPSPNEELW